MTAQTWQPGDTLPHLIGEDEDGDPLVETAACHDLIEEYDDHEDERLGGCWFELPWTPSTWHYAGQLGPHDDTLPPLPWLHGRAS